MKLLFDQNLSPSLVARLQDQADASSIGLLAIPDALRARFFASASPRGQKELGQFLTPPHVADLMAAMFDLRCRHIRLLDAGAGMGILSAAFVRRQLMRKSPPRTIEVTAYELDEGLIEGIHETYDACRVACNEKGVSFLSYWGRTFASR